MMDKPKLIFISEIPTCTVNPTDPLFIIVCQVSILNEKLKIEKKIMGKKNKAKHGKGQSFRSSN